MCMFVWEGTKNNKQSGTTLLFSYVVVLFLFITQWVLPNEVWEHASWLRKYLKVGSSALWGQFPQLLFSLQTLLIATLIKMFMFSLCRCVSSILCHMIKLLTEHIHIILHMAASKTKTSILTRPGWYEISFINIDTSFNRHSQWHNWLLGATGCALNWTNCANQTTPPQFALNHPFGRTSFWPGGNTLDSQAVNWQEGPAARSLARGPVDVGVLSFAWCINAHDSWRTNLVPGTVDRRQGVTNAVWDSRHELSVEQLQRI